MAQSPATADRNLNKRQREFVRLKVYQRLEDGEAYRQAGFADTPARSQHGHILFAKPHIQRYYNELQEQFARELEEARKVQQTAIVVNQQIQADKLEKLRIKCEMEKDYASALGCIREEDKVFGLVRDSAPIDEKQAEIDAAIREQAAKLSASDFLALPNEKQD
jgi:hypothetical protein